MLVNVEKTDALRPVELVPADGEQVDPLLFRTDLELSVGLDGIHVKDGRRIDAVDDLSDLLHRLHGSHLVVHIHDGDQNGVRPHGLPQLVQVHMAFCVHFEISHLKAHLLQKAQSVVDGRMLNIGGDNVFSRPLIG